jgi:hypothetical protein
MKRTSVLCFSKNTEFHFSNEETTFQDACRVYICLEGGGGRERRGGGGGEGRAASFIPSGKYGLTAGGRRHDYLVMELLEEKRRRK